MALYQLIFNCHITAIIPNVVQNSYSIGNVECWVQESKMREKYEQKLNVWCEGPSHVWKFVTISLKYTVVTNLFIFPMGGVPIFSSICAKPNMPKYIVKSAIYIMVYMHIPIL